MNWYYILIYLLFIKPRYKTILPYSILESKGEERKLIAVISAMLFPLIICKGLQGDYIYRQVLAPQARGPYLASQHNRKMSFVYISASPSDPKTVAYCSKDLPLKVLFKFSSHDRQRFSDVYLCINCVLISISLLTAPPFASSSVFFVFGNSPTFSSGTHTIAISALFAGSVYFQYQPHN